MTPAEQMEVNGYYVARDLLSRGEIASLRGPLTEHFVHHGVEERLGWYQGGLPCALPNWAGCSITRASSSSSGSC